MTTTTQVPMPDAAVCVDTPQKIQTGRICFIDLLRILCCFFVIVNHTCAEIFLEGAPSPTWFLSMAYFFLSKVAVPIFLIISGYTMLDHQDSHRKAFLRFFRYGLTFIFFSGIYCLSDFLSGNIGIFHLKRFPFLIINAPITNAFWYLYLYLGVLLVIPFLQKMAAVFTKTDLHILFFWSFLFYSIWPIVTHYEPRLEITQFFTVSFFSSYIALLLMGFYFKKHCTFSRRWRIPYAIGCFSSVLINVFLTYWEYRKNGGSDYLFFDNRFFLPILIGAFCLFAFCSTLKFKNTHKKIITAIAKLTFGIYLCSDLVIQKLEFIYLYLVAHHIHVIPAMLIYEICIFTVCACIVYLLKKIPVLKKLL